MAVHKFKLTVTRVDEYEVEVDDEIINDDFMKDFSENFAQVDSIEDVAAHLAVAFMREVDGDFIEGYGFVKKIRKDGSHSHAFKRDGKGGVMMLTEDEYAKGISVKPLVEDFDYETEIEEIS